MATKTNTTSNGYNYYRITRTIGHEYTGGKKKPIKKQFLGRSKHEAEAKYDAWKAEQIRMKYERKAAAEAERTQPLQNLADYYCENILISDASYSPGTRRLYADSYRKHMSGEEIMGIPVSDIKAKDLQGFYNGLDISADAIASLHKFCSAFFKWAALNDYCENIVASVSVPQKEKKKLSDGIVVWTDEEIALIESKLKDHRLFLAIELSLYAGLRISEVLGLKFADLSDGYVEVRRQYSASGFCPPKANSVRRVPMHDKIYRALDYYKEHYSNDKVYVFVSASGNIIDRRNVRTSLNRAYKSIGITPKKFHAYRATFATNLARQGVRLEVASRLLGHKSVNVTAKYYRAIDNKEYEDAISRL